MDSFFKKKVKYTKIQFIEELKNSIKDDNNEVLRNGYYEWEIKSWDKMENEYYVFSPKFKISGYTWQLKLYPKGKGDEGKNHLSLYLYNDDVEREIYPHIYSNIILYIRNNSNYSSYEAKRTFKYFNRKNNFLESTQFVNRSKLFVKNEKSGKPYIENDKTIIGVYIRVYKYNKKEQFINELKNLLDDENNSSIIKEGNYEWEMEDWNDHKNKSIIESPEFEFCDHKWKFVIYPNGTNDKNYVSLFLQNSDVMDDSSLHICVKFVLYIRNINKISFFHGDSTQYITYFNKNASKIGITQFVKKYNLYAEIEKSNKAFIEDDKTIIGTYLYIYKYDDKERYLNELSKLITFNDNEFKPIKDDYYEWEINNWDSLNDKVFSQDFIICGYKWKIKLIPNDKGDNDEEYVSIYLCNEDISDDDTHLCANFVLTLRNYNDYSCFSTRKYICPSFFDKNNNCFGIDKLIEKKKVKIKNKNSKSIVEDDKVIIGAYIRIYHYERVQYIQNLLNILKKTNDNIKENKEEYFEWEILDWNAIKNEPESHEFIASNYKWKIILKVDELENEEHISAYLKNLDVQNEDEKEINCYFVLSLRNSNDYSLFNAKVLNHKFNKNNDSCSILKFIQKNDLYRKSKSLDTSLMENEKFIIGGLIYVNDEE